MTPERLAAFRKTFGPLSTEELTAFAEGRKATKLPEEAVEAIRIMLAERKEGGHQVGGVIQPPATYVSDKNSPPPSGMPNTRRESPLFVPVAESRSSTAPSTRMNVDNSDLGAVAKKAAIAAITIAVV